MKTILSSRKHNYLKRVGIFLIAIALIVVMVGCDGVIKYDLTMAIAPTGSGTATDLTGSSPYAANTVVNITAAANSTAGYEFVSWTAPAGTFANANAAQTNFTMPAQNVTVTANFALIPTYDLTMAANPGAEGTATDLTNTSPYAAGTVVSIKAVAAADYQFVNWSAPAGTFVNPNAAETTFTMPAQNVTVTANFEQSFYGGSGTEGDPYQIADWYQLDNVRNYIDSYFILVNSLDSTTAGYTELASPTAHAGDGWQPIGTSDDRFSGTFDGQGYEIGDLFIDRSDQSDVGLFGAVDVGGVIENVEMVDADVTGNIYVGGLVGSNWYATVSDSYASGSVSGDFHVGGLVGYNNPGGYVSNCHATGSVTGEYVVGGLVGENDGDVSNSYATSSVDGGEYSVGGLVGENRATVDNCYSTGSVTGGEGSMDVGGLVGYNDPGGYVSNSHATGSVTGYQQVGGLVGDNEGPVSNSYADGDVTGDWRLGGLVGENDGDVSNSYATGSVTGGEGSMDVGGLVGDNDGDVSNSYSTGSVTGDLYVGGLVGGRSYGTVSNSFWDKDTSGQATSGGGTGEATAQMQDIDTFTGAGWDIVLIGDYVDETWYIDDGSDYPRLGWQHV